MKNKIINITLITVIILTVILIFRVETSYLGKIISLLSGGLVLLICMLLDYKNLKIDVKDRLLVCFLLLIFISTMLSSNLFDSIWGTDNRFEGLLTFITYALIYMCSKKYFKKKNIKLLADIIEYISIPIAILGIFQTFIKIEEFTPIFGRWVCGTFGNSNFYGSFIAIVISISILRFILNKDIKSLIVSNIYFYMMIICSTRSTYVAFIILIFIIIWYLLKNKDKKKIKRAGILLICFAIIFSAYKIINTINISNTNANNTVKSIATSSGINKVKNDVQTVINEGDTSKLGSGRIAVWKIVLKLIAKKPLIGCGTDNLACGIYEYCYDDYVDFGKASNTYIDKAHNEYLHIAVTNGIPSLIVYLTFIALIYIDNFKQINKNKIKFILLTTISCYLVQAFFNISTIGVAPIFWMILGIIDNKEIEEEQR